MNARDLEAIGVLVVFSTIIFTIVHIHYLYNKPQILSLKEIASLEPEVKAFIKDKKMCNFVDKYTSGFSDATTPYTDKDISNIRMCIIIGRDNGPLKRSDLLEEQVKAAAQ
jgi:hypothetical protein